MGMHGEEQFLLHGKAAGMNVYDFWRFAYSDLNADPRDDVAEYLVSRALGIEKPFNKENWTPYDISYRGKRIEVKCTGYFQTWRTDSNVCPHRIFSIRKAHHPDTGVFERQNDVYVFCLLLGNTREEANVLDLENWEFYIVPTLKIDAICGDNKTISLSRIKNLGFDACGFEEIKSRIDAELDNMEKRI